MNTDQSSSTSANESSRQSLEISPVSFKTLRERRISNIRNSLSLVNDKSSCIFIKSSILCGDDDDNNNEFKIFSTKKFNDQYILMDKIGEGGSAVVKKTMNRETGQIFAAKVIRTRDQEYLASIKNEYLLLKQLNHPNIIMPNELIFDEENGFVYIIMEYFDGITLEEYILEHYKLDESETISILKQLLSALKYLQENCICHRDLTANNILISQNGDIKIIDFTISRRLKINDDPRLGPRASTSTSTIATKSKFSRRKSDLTLSKMLTPKGTLEYQAPEILMGSFYDESVDMWSVGVITYFCLMGYKPFHNKMAREVTENIINCRYSLNDQDLSYESIKFISNCLTKHSLLRMSSKEALLHPWIKGIRIVDYPKNLLKNKICPKVQDDESIIKQELPVKRLRKSSSDIDLNLLC